MDDEVIPAVNQIEIHPSHQQKEPRAADRGLGIVTQAWSPLGSGGDLADPVITAIAAAHGSTPAQAVLSWHLQSGIHPVVKASSAAHLAGNLAAGGIRLHEADLAPIATLDRGISCFGLDPHTFLAPEGYADFCP